MGRYRSLVLLLVFLACIIAAPVSYADSGGFLQICYIGTDGQCDGSGGWFSQTNLGDSCGASIMRSQFYPSVSDAVWIDNEVPSRSSMVACELSINRPTWHIFVGRSSGQPNVSFPNAKVLAEWYPFHGEFVGTVTGYYGCPPASDDNGFITQWTFAWTGDTPPTVSERQGEWNRAISCVTSGTEPMGRY